MVKYTGSWHSIRETVVCNIKDLDGQEFEIRLLVDTGATCSTMPLATLYKTRGHWDVGTIPVVHLHGINSVSKCDLMCRAEVKPGNHLKSDFKKAVGIPENFSITVDFLIMRGVEVFDVIKRELPDDLKKQLANPKYHLADPEQITDGDSRLYIHGILGVKAITEMNRTGYEKITGTEMTLCRSNLGDLLFGASHFVEKRNGKNPIPMNDNDEWEQPINSKSICSANMIQGGLEEIAEEKKELVENSNQALSVPALQRVEEDLTSLLE